MTTDRTRLGQWFAVAPNARTVPTESAEGKVHVNVREYEDVYRDEFDFVWRTVRRLGIPDSAVEDVVQDVFVSAYRKFAEYNQSLPVRAWLFGFVSHVVRNHKRRYLRKESKWTEAERDSNGNISAAGAPVAEANIEQRESLELIHRVFRELSDDHCEILTLVELDETSVAESATILGINLNTAYSRLRAARREFDEALERIMGAERP